MNRCYLTVASVFAATCLSWGQASNPFSTEAKQAYTGIKNNLTRMAESMPEENYGFKPTPEIRSFGQLVGHVADAQMRTCSAINGEMKSGGAFSKTSKEDLVAALKEAFAECDKAYDSLTDASATEMIKSPRGQRTKLGALYGNIIHDNEEYGYMAVYMRLKGVVPPSSARR